MILVQKFMLINNHIKTWVLKSTEMKLLIFKLFFLIGIYSMQGWTATASIELKEKEA